MRFGYPHMGQFPQDGENGQNVAFSYFFWRCGVTKRFDFFNFSQLFWRDFFPLDFKNVFVSVLANPGSELELFEVDDIGDDGDDDL